MKTKIQIKSISGSVLFEYSKENNTIKETLLKAIKDNADLSNADLSNAVLSYADLGYADLSNADLRYADLRYAVLRNAVLRNAVLSYAVLRYADLGNADLRYADLSYAVLSYAVLSNADLRYADLSKIKHHFQIIPGEGSFIAWKACQKGLILKLEIPKEAKRTSSLIGRKCRAEFVKVLEIYPLKRKAKIAYGQHNGLEYEKGKIVKADSFDPDIRVECSHGIHFFVTRKEAEGWL